MVSPRKRDAASKVVAASRDNVGIWVELACEPAFGSGDKKYALKDVTFRNRFKRAMEGDLPAIRAILRMLKANEKERDRNKVCDDALERCVREKRYSALRKSERAADPALLLLGICAVGNEELARLGAADGPGFDGRLKALRPTHVMQWVADFARGRPDCPALSESQEDEIANFIRDDDAIILRDWHTRRSEVTAGLMRVRGPEATRFAPGRSGNSRGRPRGPKLRKSCSEYPFDGFFMEPATLRIGGQDRTMTRMDALMCNLVMRAAKGDDEIEAVIMPILARHVEEKWFYDRYGTIEFTEIRG